jgi:hypothetical protein
MCFECCWHAIVASLIVEDKRDYYDKIILVIFSIVFILIHIVFLVLFLSDFKKIKQLDEIEIEYKKISSGTTFSV